MNLLIKSARIIDPNSEYHNKVMDVFIKHGKIKKIAKSIKSCPESIANKTEIEYKAKNLHLSPGWFDFHANFGEPGRGISRKTRHLQGRLREGTGACVNVQHPQHPVDSCLSPRMENLRCPWEL